jgi:hypothetical protein
MYGHIIQKLYVQSFRKVKHGHVYMSNHGDSCPTLLYGSSGSIYVARGIFLTGELV